VSGVGARGISNPKKRKNNSKEAKMGEPPETRWGKSSNLRDGVLKGVQQSSKGFRRRLGSSGRKRK